MIRKAQNDILVISYVCMKKHEKDMKRKMHKNI